jgi:hypothetical protein
VATHWGLQKRRPHIFVCSAQVLWYCTVHRCFEQLSSAITLRKVTLGSALDAVVNFAGETNHDQRVMHKTTVVSLAKDRPCSSRSETVIVLVL